MTAEATRITELEDALSRAVDLLWEHCEGLAPHIDSLEAVLNRDAALGSGEAA